MSRSPAVAVRTGEHVDREDLLEQIGPGNAVLACDLRRLRPQRLLRHPRRSLRRRRDGVRRGRHDPSPHLGVRREHAVVPQAVNPRRRYQRREPGQELVGPEEEEQRSAARTLHPVDEPALLALREPLQRERRSQEVAAEPLAPVTIVAVDPDAGVQREAIEKGAVAAVAKLVGEPQPPVHLGGLEGGQGVSLGVPPPRRSRPGPWRSGGPRAPGCRPRPRRSAAESRRSWAERRRRG